MLPDPTDTSTSWKAELAPGRLITSLTAGLIAGGVEPIPSDDQFHRSFGPLGLSIKKLSLIFPGCTKHSQVPRHTHVVGTRQDVRDGPGPSSPIFSQKINR